MCGTLSINWALGRVGKVLGSLVVTPLVALLALVMAGCANVNTAQSGKLPVIEVAPLPSPADPLATVIPSDGTEAFKSYPTSTGGGIAITAAYQTAIRTGESYQGFAGEGDLHYVLIRRPVSGAVIWWDLYWRSVPVGTWALACSWLDDGAFSGAIAVSGATLWMYSDSGYRRFSLSDCQEQKRLAVSTSSSDYYFLQSTYFAVSGDDLWREERHSYGYTRLRRYRMSTFAFEQTISPSTVGVHTSVFDRTFGILGGQLWSYSLCGSKYCLWKTDAGTGKAIGFAEMPEADYPDFHRYKSTRWPGSARMAIQNQTTLWMIVPGSSDFRVYRLDVSKF
jgi:hypothetical protein